MSYQSIFQEKQFNLTRLTCLAKSLNGQYTIVDLRNDASVNGKIEHVDGCMNITMSDVIFTTIKGEQFYFESFYIRDRNIRYIHVPKEVSVMDAIVTSLNQIKFPKISSSRRSKKMSMLMLRQIETKKRVEEILKEKEKKKAEEAAKKRSSSDEDL